MRFHQSLLFAPIEGGILASRVVMFCSRKGLVRLVGFVVRGREITIMHVVSILISVNFAGFNVSS